MSIKRYKRVVLIGRFQSAHNGHLANFLQALDIAEKVIILVGSSFQPRTPKNPFKFAERKEMITSAIEAVRPNAQFEIYPLRDFKYSNNNWISNVQSVVKTDSPDIDDADIAIMGYDKDDSSWYNHAFPEWDFIPLNGFVEHGSQPIDATKVRELYFEGHLDYIQGAVPAAVFEYMKSWRNTPGYSDMVEEYIFYKDYHKSWESAPFVPVFQTTDAVVIQGGHILLIQRGYAPGKGLWALPGGFINPKERLADCVIRELVEETKIKVPEIVLRKGITYNETFDHPDRDLRGRTITMAYLIELTGGDGKLPRVKGSDDAKKAKWFKLSEIDKMEELIYGDHKHIINTLVARARG
jgi:bifunctional NMN adenylyltransferase/nudix hydrolase